MNGPAARLSLGIALGSIGLVLLACSAHRPEDSAGSNADLQARSAADLPTVARTGSVLQHHGNGTRDGLYVDPALTRQAVGTLHRDTTFAGVVTGEVYAQPLWVEHGPNDQEAFIVATEENHVTAIDRAGNTIWDKTYGTPVTSGLPCGNIRPLGITGTPVVDVSSRTVYFGAMTTPDGSALEHKIFAVSLDDGSVKAGWPVDFESIVPGSRAANHNQRGALQLVNGVLYVPYGGHFGDCDPYKGTVVGVPVDNPSQARSWSTGAKRGGIWSVGGVATDGNAVYASTGNTGNTSTWGGGEAIIRLSAGPTFSTQAADFYAPSNWQEMDNADIDLGGANPLLLDMPGTPNPHLVLAFGKDGNLYILNRDNLGGIGGELSKAHVSNGSILGASTAYRTSQGTYVAFRGRGVGCPSGGAGNLTVVKIIAENPPRAQVAWCSDESSLGSPTSTSPDANGSTGTIVWDANGKLYGYDGDTGAKVFAGGTADDALPARMHYFNTPIATNGRIAVATKGKLVIFKP